MKSIARVLNTVNSWLFTTDEQQNWLIKFILIAFLVYAVCSALLAYGVWIGVAEATETYLLIAAMMASNIFFYAAIRSGWNLRFRDRALTMGQLLSALTWCACAYGVANEAHGGMLMPLALVLVFGIFKVRQKQTLIGSVYAVLSTGCVMLYKGLTDPLVYNPHVQVAFFVMTVTIIGTIATFTVTLAGMRQRIKQQNLQLAEAMLRFQVRGELPDANESDVGKTQDRLWQQFVELAQQRRELDERRNMMLAAISHDLRSPLARIRLATELLPRLAGMEERRKGFEERRESIVRNVDVANRLLTDFIDMARVDHEPMNERVDLSALLSDVALETPDLHILERPDGPQWLSPTSAVALERVLRNVIDNATVYGAPPLEMGLRCDSRGTLLWLRDHGPGVDPEQYEYFLQPFTRGETNRLRPGTGLGLAIVQRTLARHGGRVVLANAHPGLRVELHFPPCEQEPG